VGTSLEGRVRPRPAESRSGRQEAHKVWLTKGVACVLDLLPVSAGYAALRLHPGDYFHGRRCLQPRQRTRLQKKKRIQRESKQKEWRFPLQPRRNTLHRCARPPDSRRRGAMITGLLALSSGLFEWGVRRKN
jgi:hypothetical protein